jgi:hypothetical protein
MTYYIRNGDSFEPTSEASLDIHNQLPPGNYILYETLFGWRFTKADPFDIPPKLYGDVEKKANRILTTFQHRPNITGALLAGLKGSGKTQLARVIGTKAHELGMPVIIVNSPYNGDGFNKLVQDLQQPAVFLFDEFEKTYDSDQQEGILTLLDGVFPTKKLFIFTVNNEYRVDDHMRNRPGRIYYMLRFKGLEMDFIREYCEDQLNDKSQVEAVCRVSTLFWEFNFDILKALIEEMNRYNETAVEAIKMLNAKPDSNGQAEYDVKLTVDGDVIPVKDISPEVFEGNPVTFQRVCISYYTPCYADEDAEEHDVIFSPDDLIKVDPFKGTVEYQNKDGNKVIFTKKKNNDYDALSVL